ncbi:SulP family inorganic anion transporter [Ferruginibacter yonginensis]|uniref:SulP family inorganic anion transporter n=1 Tax=Ferruginibacter yonginensis TaxID=1310416 RepID=A0ABV8QTT3_9BACT
MQKYFKSIGSDLPSALVVFLVAIPLCLGIAVASGLNEFSGIIGGIVGGIVVGIISGSNLSVSGPAAGLTAIVSAAVLKLPAVEAFFLAVVIAGVFQLLMGIFKLGVIGDYVPNSVIKGMLAAIGIILILKQLPHLVGYDKDFEGDETFIQASGENTFSSVINSLNHLTPLAVVIGVVGIAILILFETKFIKSIKVFQIISGPLVVVVVGVLLHYFLSDTAQPFTVKSVDLVNIPIAKDTKEFISFFHLPNWSFITNKDVWITAVTLALVASLETLLGIEAVDKLDPMQRITPPNRELVAQGAGNIVSGLLGGLPLTSVIVRSSANVNAGARTKMSTIFHGTLIFICVAFVPNLLNLIPKAALAAVLIFTGYKLAKISIFKDYWKKGWEQFMPFVITITAIVLTDLLKGVLIGIGVGIFYVIRSNFRTAIFMVQDGNQYLIRLRKDVSFFSKPKLKHIFENMPNNASVIIDLTKAEFIDQDIIDTINEFDMNAPERNIQVTVKKSTYNESHKLVGSDQFNISDSAH